MAAPSIDTLVTSFTSAAANARNYSAQANTARMKQAVAAKNKRELSDTVADVENLATAAEISAKEVETRIPQLIALVKDEKQALVTKLQETRSQADALQSQVTQAQEELTQLVEMTKQQRQASQKLLQDVNTKLSAAEAATEVSRQAALSAERDLLFSTQEKELQETLATLQEQVNAMLAQSKTTVINYNRDYSDLAEKLQQLEGGQVEQQNKLNEDLYKAEQQALESEKTLQLLELQLKTAKSTNQFSVH